MKPVQTNHGQGHDFYIPSLDGVRALAFGIVMLSHVPHWVQFPGGLGVTIFFFLSGFLITTLLRREASKAGSISIRKFYVRRVLRIFPPMYLTLGLGIVLSALEILPGRPTLRGIAFEAAHLTNYFLIAGHDGEVVAGQRVYWSLAVEEHFYLMFPLIAAWLVKSARPARAIVLMSVVCAAALAWRVILVLHFDVPAVRIQYASDTRIDSILFGAIMAFGFNPVLDAQRLVGTRSAAGVFCVSLVGMLATVLSRDFVFRETLRYTVQGLLLMPIFYVLITRSQWPLIRWLNWRWVRFLGATSYTLYLVHDTILQALHFHLPQTPVLLMAAAALIGSLAYATAMRRWVEVPLLAWRRRLRD